MEAHKILDLRRDTEESQRRDQSHNAGLSALVGYRPDYKNKYQNKKYGGKGGLEPTPIDYATPRSLSYKESNPDVMRRGVEALRAARDMGYSMPSEIYNPKFLAALSLKEGRADFGANEYNQNNKAAQEIFDKIAPRFGTDAARFAAAVYDKGQAATRTKLPFTTVWNGAGKLGDASGENYTSRFPQFLKAAEHPKNAALVGFIDQHLNNTEYTTPLLKSTTHELETAYDKKKRDAYTQTAKKLDASPLRSLQYTFLGGADNMLGVPKEYDPRAMEAAVPAPDLEALRKQREPKYNAGGNIENTTHDRKII